MRGKDLNLRPLGYEPNELPDCSTPQNYPSVWQSPGQTLVTDLFRPPLYNRKVHRLVVLAALALAADLSAQTALFPLKDIKPGMRGTGRTVFNGNKIEDFDVEILGVSITSDPRNRSSSPVCREDRSNIPESCKA